MRHSNKFNLKHIMMLLFLVSATAIFESCKKAAEKTTEKMIEKSIGDKAKVDIDNEKVTIETEEGTFTTDATVHSWPDEAPEEVPEFAEGKVMSVSTQEMDDTKNWVVIFEEVPQTALQNYKKELEAKGFKINYTTVAGTGGHLAAEKGKLNVMVMVGDGNATVTIGSQP
ncbi:hypothetical protein FK220_010370 [Flavobacteriaceae bacterium TP-CH-4]|uniref:Uncharacterized protein n=1 Tax=Pelagihabitans pacificus TaxID=2696054 RepID=A0A967EDV9_9FLAO|nr:hypothetical protein [Pelagihabitans pacificus]NHF59748.1 hypothetical protein [Pelagihabitans pacificus]